MTQIVAGVFDDEQSATAAAHELRSAGFEAADLDQFALNPPGRHNDCRSAATRTRTPKAEGGGKGALTGAAIGTAIGAVGGSRGDATGRSGRDRRRCCGGCLRGLAGRCRQHDGRRSRRRRNCGRRA